MDIGPEIDRLIDAREKGIISEKDCDQMIDDLIAEHTEYRNQNRWG